MHRAIISLTLSYTFILFYLSLRRIPPELGDIFSYQDKFMHLGAYLLLGLSYQKSLPSKRWAMLVAVSVGIIIEILQSFISYRSFELLDIVANSCGVGLSYFIFKSKLFR